jgi:CYTH domain-containing protein
VLAELELPDADHPIAVPEWLAPVLVREVTGEREYANSNLAH